MLELLQKEVTQNYCDDYFHFKINDYQHQYLAIIFHFTNNFLSNHFFLQSK